MLSYWKHLRAQEEWDIVLLWLNRRMKKLGKLNGFIIHDSKKIRVMALLREVQTLRGEHLKTRMNSLIIKLKWRKREPILKIKRQQERLQKKNIMIYSKKIPICLNLLMQMMGR